VIPLVVAASRLYRGMHYLTDVLGGVLLGTVWLYAAVHGIRLGVAHWQLRHAGGAADWQRRRSAVRHG
jgi:membrane-associated phospholipid phosphatase